MKNSKITADKIREVLDYNPDSGEFKWKKRLSQGTQAGTVAGCLNTMGYWQIGVLAEKHYGHRLGWLHYYGEWPQSEVDHIDGNPANNRINNLRLAGRSTNMQNLTRVNKKTQSGILGVHVTKQGFSSKIMINYKSIHLGNFKTAEEAHAAYVAAKRELHEGNTL
jgi:hypothetical protein